jgi:hypothetical protein
MRSSMIIAFVFGLVVALTCHGTEESSFSTRQTVEATAKIEGRRLFPYVVASYVLHQFGGRIASAIVSNFVTTTTPQTTTAQVPLQAQSQVAIGVIDKLTATETSTEIVPLKPEATNFAINPCIQYLTFLICVYSNETTVVPVTGR